MMNCFQAECIWGTAGYKAIRHSLLDLIISMLTDQIWSQVEQSKLDMSHSQMLGKVESGGGPMFKVVLEC